MLMASERGNNLPAAGNLNLFVGRDFVITVHSEPVALLDRVHSLGEDMRADQVLYRVIDGVVESWLPSIERLEDSIERLQDQVIGWPRPTLVEQIAETRNTLLQLRRIVSGTRRAVFQLRHVVSPIIGEDMSPFLRDVHGRPGDQSRNHCRRA
jgi:magnesium transporter